ncbi:PLD nuclease N-terminal domain-containing protein [Thalassobacillus hwangdonensis]|uniref:PLD nuclease N-terminal domain-containing protein n=1 Tax=Thalassobacillus hwangdonensis TaxID=546108 RepID=A0ABW3L5H0_9BACI
MMEELANVNWGLIAPIIILELILMIVALIDWAKNKETNGPRFMWLFVIILISLIGPILYFVIGRKQN